MNEMNEKKHNDGDGSDKGAFFSIRIAFGMIGCGIGRWLRTTNNQNKKQKTKSPPSQNKHPAFPEN